MYLVHLSDPLCYASLKQTDFGTIILVPLLILILNKDSTS